MEYTIAAFYEFKSMSALGSLEELKERLKRAMDGHGVKGTIIIADEGFNAAVCARAEALGDFLRTARQMLRSEFEFKTSFHSEMPFRRAEVKIKPEIVTLKRPVDIGLGEGTHVAPKEWNELISRPDVVLLDTRNDYEFQTGTFRNAINPKTSRFSQLPLFIEENREAFADKKIAMFCTGGIRCEKFVPYLKGLGFEEVFQLEGGILKYLEEVDADESLWEGECFVFDQRLTLDNRLRKGALPDLSQNEGP